MLKRADKIKEVEALKKKFQTAKAILFAENKGLKVSQMTVLRKVLQKEKASVKVVKNRLLKRALQEAKIEGLEFLIGGSIALASSELDPVVIAKALVDFVKENETLVVKGGYVDGQTLNAERVKFLASLPPKEELYAMLLRCLIQPATQVVNVLSAVPRNLVNVLEAIGKQKEGG